MPIYEYAPRVRYDAPALVEFAKSLLTGAGMPRDRAADVADVADILVEGDLLGHDTHGLQLLASYLRHIEAGQMKLEDEPITLADHGAVLSWDGQRLPGPWLVLRAMDIAVEKARIYGSGAVPGQNGLARRERQLRDGVELEPSILPALTPWAEKFCVALPGVL